MRHPQATAAGPPGPAVAAQTAQAPSWKQLKQPGPLRRAVTFIVVGTVLMAGIGFSGSYDAVQKLADDLGFGWFSYVLPIGVDAGIGVLLGLDLMLTWLRMPFSPLRYIAWLLTLATIAFNAASAWPTNGPWDWRDVLAAGMHAVIPLLFVIVVEAARHAVGRAADIVADQHMEKVRLTRWLLSPVPTFKLWRRMKLWELRTYDEAISAEQARLVYRAKLQARYGRNWKRKAPDEVMMPLRLAAYGIPLWKTGPPALESVGIQIDIELLRPRALRELPATDDDTIVDADIVEDTVEQPEEAEESPAVAELPAVEQAPEQPVAPQIEELTPEQHYVAFHQYVSQYGGFPTADQLSTHLAGVYGRSVQGPTGLQALVERYNTEVYGPAVSAPVPAEPYGPEHRYGDPVTTPYTEPVVQRPEPVELIKPDPAPYVEPEQPVAARQYVEPVGHPEPAPRVEPEPLVTEKTAASIPQQSEPVAPARGTGPARVQAKVDDAPNEEQPVRPSRSGNTRAQVAEIYRGLSDQTKALRGRPLAQAIVEASGETLKFDTVRRTHISDDLLAEYEQGTGE
ncbi:DUF2637 domain-containing protein [Streptomyces sp. NPDC102437]|uniref:DUF2637 domain-containing protein n=1 Tax=Streptomyces sp. NPDC102437 TaxID=3366175 RepID=UPI003804D120